MSANKFAVIKNGRYRGNDIEGRYPLVKPWKDGAKGGFVTVQHGKDVIRVTVKQKDVTYTDMQGAVIDVSTDQSIRPPNPNAVNGDGFAHFEISTAEQEYLSMEDEEMALVRINQSFDVLDQMTRACVKGTCRGLIVSGPPGIGKSYGVEAVLNEHGFLSKMAADSDRFIIVKGTTTAIALYQILYEYHTKDCTVVFDDCDGIFADLNSLNLLKAALDTGRQRWISWNAESRVLAEAGIPDKFEFKGSIIFLTNIDFDRTRSKQLQPHLQALKSRCLYLHLEISTTKDLMLRIKQIMDQGMLAEYDFEKEEETEIFDFINENKNHLLEVSLRTVLKVATLRKSHPSTWKMIALRTVMKKEAYFNHLLAATKAAKEAAEKATQKAAPKKAVRNR